MYFFRLTNSSYKHRNTFKDLVGVAPNGVVTFVSDLYPWSTSDKQIVANCSILDILLMLMVFLYKYIIYLWHLIQQIQIFLNKVFLKQSNYFPSLHPLLLIKFHGHGGVHAMKYAFSLSVKYNWP